MKKFLHKIITYCLLLSTLLALFASLDFFVVKNQYLYGYNASIIDKIEQLKRINEPKIILVGNSNLSFGINSQLIEEELNMPVINLGLHGGLGNAFHENMAKYNINEGDIVIICHSNYNDIDDVGDYELVWTTVEKHSDLYDLIRNKDIPNLLKVYPKYALKCFKLWATNTGNQISESCYSRKAFNSYGDIIYRPTSEEYIFNEGSVVIPSISNECISRINDFNVYVKNCGATLLVAGYPIGYGKYTPSKDGFIEFQNELSNELDCDVISDFTDYFIPYQYFYNTNLHLTEKGAELRTQQLIKDIKQWMN